MEAHSSVPTSFEIAMESARQQHVAQLHQTANEREMRAARRAGDALLFELEELMAADPVRPTPSRLIGMVRAYEQAFPVVGSEEPDQTAGRPPMALADALDTVFRVQQGLSARQTRKELGASALTAAKDPIARGRSVEKVQKDHPVPATPPPESSQLPQASRHRRWSWRTQAADEAGYTPDARKLESLLRAAGGTSSPGGVRQALPSWSEARIFAARDLLHQLGHVTITGSNTSHRRWNLIAEEPSEAAV